MSLLAYKLNGSNFHGMDCTLYRGRTRAMHLSDVVQWESTLCFVIWRLFAVCLLVFEFGLFPRDQRLFESAHTPHTHSLKPPLQKMHRSRELATKQANRCLKGNPFQESAPCSLCWPKLPQLAFLSPWNWFAEGTPLSRGLVNFTCWARIHVFFMQVYPTSTPETCLMGFAPTQMSRHSGISQYSPMGS